MTANGRAVAWESERAGDVQRARVSTLAAAAGREQSWSRTRRDGSRGRRGTASPGATSQGLRVLRARPESGCAAARRSRGGPGRTYQLRVRTPRHGRVAACGRRRHGGRSRRRRGCAVAVRRRRRRATCRADGVTATRCLLTSRGPSPPARPLDVAQTSTWPLGQRTSTVPRARAAPRPKCSAQVVVRVVARLAQHRPRLRAAAGRDDAPSRPGRRGSSACPPASPAASRCRPRSRCAAATAARSCS